MDLEVDVGRQPSEEPQGEGVPFEIDQKPPFFDQNSTASKARSKSSLRIRYEAETEIIRRKIGSLEGIRQQLGLSQRKICQLLLVDPSAWSRWVRDDEDAPPHIYRMLQWYLALQDKYPALDVNFWLSTIARTQGPERLEVQRSQLAKVTGEFEVLQAQLRELQCVVEKQRLSLLRWMLVSAATGVLVCILMFLRFAGA